MLMKNKLTRIFSSPEHAQGKLLGYRDIRDVLLVYTLEGTVLI